MGIGRCIERANRGTGKMADGYFDTVVSLTDARRSALFYEHVIPLAPFDLITSLLQAAKRGADLKRIRELDDQIFRDFADNLRSLSSNKEYLPTILRHHGDFDGQAHKK
jgi:hypothetical protein